MIIISKPPPTGKMINLHQKRTGEYGNGEKSLDDISFTLDSGCGRDYVVTE